MSEGELYKRIENLRTGLIIQRNKITSTEGDVQAQAYMTNIIDKQIILLDIFLKIVAEAKKDMVQKSFTLTMNDPVALPEPFICIRRSDWEKWLGDSK